MMLSTVTPGKTTKSRSTSHTLLLSSGSLKCRNSAPVGTQVCPHLPFHLSYTHARHRRCKPRAQPAWYATNYTSVSSINIQVCVRRTPKVLSRTMAACSPRVSVRFLAEEKGVAGSNCACLGQHLVTRLNNEEELAVLPMTSTRFASVKLLNDPWKRSTARTGQVEQ